MTSPLFGSGPDNQSDRDDIIVVGPGSQQSGGKGEESEEQGGIADMVEQPAKVMRIGTMIKQLLEEVRAAPLDDASRTRLKEIHASSIRELEEGLAPELREELERLALPFGDDTTPSDAELRIAQAQLVGWLEGLFHGIQTALFAQQMAARAQLEQMRQGQLPGPGAPDTVPAAATASPERGNTCSPVVSTLVSTVAPGVEPPPEVVDSRTVRRAVDDLREGFRQHELWLLLGWQDIKQRYRRSMLGPLWITVATAVTAVAMGFLYAELFHIDIQTFLPHVTLGLIFWNFISQSILEARWCSPATKGCSSRSRPR